MTVILYIKYINFDVKFHNQFYVKTNDLTHQPDFSLKLIILYLY